MSAGRGRARLVGLRAEGTGSAGREFMELTTKKENMKKGREKKGARELPGYGT